MVLGEFGDVKPSRRLAMEVVDRAAGWVSRVAAAKADEVVKTVADNKRSYKKTQDKSPR